MKWGTGSAWAAEYVDPTTGKRRSKQMAKKADLAAFLEGLKQPVAVAPPTGATRTVGEVCRAWAEEARDVGLHGEEPIELLSYEVYEQHIRLHIEPLIGRRLVAGLTAPDIAEFRSELLKPPRSRAMAKKALTSLKGALNYAVTMGWIPANPASTIRIIGGGRHKEAVVIPTREQLRVILAKLDELASQSERNAARAWGRWRVYVRAAIASGLRASELRGMPKSGFSADLAQLKVTQRADEKRVIGPPKSIAGRRSIDLGPTTMAMLTGWLDNECPAGEWLFPGMHGGIEFHANILRAWYRLLRECGLADAGINWHSLRHAHASLLIARGLPVKEVQEQMGHSSVQVTLDIYGHLFPEDRGRRRLAAEGVDLDLSP